MYVCTYVLCIYLLDKYAKTLCFYTHISASGAAPPICFFFKNATNSAYIVCVSIICTRVNLSTAGIETTAWKQCDFEVKKSESILLSCISPYVHV